MIYFFLGIFFVLFSSGFYVSLKILDFLTTYLTSHFNLLIIALSPVEVLFTILRLDLILITLVVLPFVLIWLMAYLKPALYPQERNFLSYIPIIYFLSVIGTCVGWLMATKLFIPYLQSFSSLIKVQNNWALDGLISFILMNILAGIMICQVPLIVSTLVDLKILKLEKLTLVRKIVIVAAVTIGAIVTPTPDMFNQLVVAIPIYLLFEVTIQYCRLKQRFFQGPAKRKLGKKVRKP